MQKIKVAFIGLNNLFGRITAFLLRQSPVIEKLNLFGDKRYKGNYERNDNSNCKITTFHEKDKLYEALQGVDIVVIGDQLVKFNENNTEYEQTALKIIDYTKIIAHTAPNAFLVVTASPVNIFMPLVSQLYEHLGCNCEKKLVGATSVDTLRANNLLASEYRIDPMSAVLPVVGGSTSTTRVPLFSHAYPTRFLPKEQQNDIIDKIRNCEDLTLNNYEANSIEKAYATVRFIHSIGAGLKGQTQVPEIALIRNPLKSEIEYFSLPILIGKNGIEKVFQLKNITKYEENLIKDAVNNLKKDINKAKSFLKYEVNNDVDEVISNENFDSDKDYIFINGPLLPENGNSSWHLLTKKDHKDVNVKQPIPLHCPAEPYLESPSVSSEKTSLKWRSHPIPSHNIKKKNINEFNEEGFDKFQETPTILKEDKYYPLQRRLIDPHQQSDMNFPEDQKTDFVLNDQAEINGIKQELNKSINLVKSFYKEKRAFIKNKSKNQRKENDIENLIRTQEEHESKITDCTEKLSKKPISESEQNVEWAKYRRATTNLVEILDKETQNLKNESSYSVNIPLKVIENVNKSDETDPKCKIVIVDKNVNIPVCNALKEELVNEIEISDTQQGQKEEKVLQTARNEFSFQYNSKNNQLEYKEELIKIEKSNSILKQENSIPAQQTFKELPSFKIKKLPRKSQNLDNSNNIKISKYLEKNLLPPSSNSNSKLSSKPQYLSKSEFQNLNDNCMGKSYSQNALKNNYGNQKPKFNNKVEETQENFNHNKETTVTKGNLESVIGNSEDTEDKQIKMHSYSIFPTITHNKSNKKDINPAEHYEVNNRISNDTKIDLNFDSPRYKMDMINRNASLNANRTKIKISGKKSINKNIKHLKYPIDVFNKNRRSIGKSNKEKQDFVEQVEKFEENVIPISSLKLLNNEISDLISTKNKVKSNILSEENISVTGMEHLGNNVQCTTGCKLHTKADIKNIDTTENVNNKNDEVVKVEENKQKYDQNRQIMKIQNIQCQSNLSSKETERKQLNIHKIKQLNADQQKSSYRENYISNKVNIPRKKEKVKNKLDLIQIEKTNQTKINKNTPNENVELEAEKVWRKSKSLIKFEEKLNSKKIKNQMGKDKHLDQKKVLSKNWIKDKKSMVSNDSMLKELQVTEKSLFVKNKKDTNLDKQKVLSKNCLKDKKNVICNDSVMKELQVTENSLFVENEKDKNLGQQKVLSKNCIKNNKSMIYNDSALKELQDTENKEELAIPEGTDPSNLPGKSNESSNLTTESNQYEAIPSEIKIIQNENYQASLIVANNDNQLGIANKSKINDTQNDQLIPVTNLKRNHDPILINKNPKKLTQKPVSNNKFERIKTSSNTSKRSPNIIKHDKSRFQIPYEKVNSNSMKNCYINKSKNEFQLEKDLQINGNSEPLMNKKYTQKIQVSGIDKLPYKSIQKIDEKVEKHIPQRKQKHKDFIVSKKSKSSITSHNYNLLHGDYKRLTVANNKREDSPSVFPTKYEIWKPIEEMDNNNMMEKKISTWGKLYQLFKNVLTKDLQEEEIHNNITRRSMKLEENIRQKRNDLKTKISIAKRSNAKLKSDNILKKELNEHSIVCDRESVTATRRSNDAKSSRKSSISSIDRKRYSIGKKKEMTYFSRVK